jgi:tetratricopeptide (TPR) repeat protein
MDKIKTLEKAIITAHSTWQFRRIITLGCELLTAVPHTSQSHPSRLLALHHLGDASRRLGHDPEAMEWYEQCFEEAGEHGRYAVLALEGIAHILAQSGKIDEAQAKLQDAYQLAEHLNDPYSRAIVIHQKGHQAWFQEHLEDSLVFYQQALSVYQQLRYLESQLAVWTDIGLAHHYIGRLDKAINCYQEALKIARHLQHPTIGMLLSNIGECYQDLFAFEQARQYHQDAITATKSLPLETDNLLSTLADSYRNLGVDLYLLGEINNGRKQLQKALSLLDEEDDLDIRMQTYYTFGLMELEQAHWDKVWHLIQESLALSDEHELRVHKARVLYLAGLYQQQKGDRAAAQAALQEAQFLAHDTGQRWVLWQVHAAQGELADNKALTAVHNQIAAEILHQIAAPITDDVLRQTFLNAPQVKRVLDTV